LYKNVKALNHYYRHFIQITDELKAKVEDESRGDPMREALACKLLIDTIPLLEATPGPRFIKTHIPFSLLPPNLLDTCKVNFYCSFEFYFYTLKFNNFNSNLFL
jgi:hypothetical protein